ncbi:MAG TPA: cytochrome c [Dongiaceae bacterium]|jgi:cytochrome c556|nr:cytochrome c [Dongiaceae bacterium]
MNWKRVSAVALGLSVSVVLVGVGFAADNERETTMKNIGRSLRPLAQMAKSDKFDQAEAQKDGNAIAGYLDHFKDLFPEGSDKEDDKALPAIWSDRAGFEQHRTDAKNAAIAVAAATDMAGFQTAFKSLGAACGACHDKYRAKE